MISGLIDELNKSADEWNGSNMFELARMCREAADTIWELRDDLQRANAENDKLREELDAAKHDLSVFSGEIVASKAENAKLRELVADMWRFTGTACKKYPRLFDQPAQGGQMVMPNMLDSFEQRMHELGIETDDGVS